MPINRTLRHISRSCPLCIDRLIYIISVRSALKKYKSYCINGRFEFNRNVISNLGDNVFSVVGLIPMIILVLFLVVVPLLFSAAVAFTDYSSPDHIYFERTPEFECSIICEITSANAVCEYTFDIEL